jgi:hypothetical protein
MRNSITSEVSEYFSRAIPAVGRMPQPIYRKPRIDPMKFFPHLFQLGSLRFSETGKLARKTHQAAPDRRNRQDALFLAFRSPSDQQFVIAVPSCQDYDRSEARLQHWMH